MQYQRTEVGGLGQGCEKALRRSGTKITRKDKVVDEHKQLIAEKEDLLIVIEEERCRLAFDLLDLQRRQETQKALLNLVQKLLTVQKFVVVSLRFSNNLYFILAFHYQFEEIRNKITRLHESTEILRSDRLKLLDLLDAHYQSHDLHHQELLDQAQETIDNISEGVDFGTEWAQVLFVNMKEELDSVKAIDLETIAFRENSKKRLKFLKAADIEDVTKLRLPLAPVTWGHITSMKDAMEVLNTRMQINPMFLHKSTLEALRSFFVSPDVAAIFRDLDNITKPAFLRLVNDFLEVKVSPQRIEAFLYYCNEVGDLFSANRASRVSTYHEGWELVHEMPVAGPARAAKHLLPLPHGAVDFWRWLRQSQDLFLILDRKITESALINFMRDRYPPFQRLRPDAVKQHLHYFHNSGLRYLYTNETTEAGTPILFRIDNGWDSPRYTRYDPVIKNPAPWFKHPRSLTRNPKVIVSLKAERYGDKKVLREEMLYEMLEPVF
ncbi:hypothetical protein L207DRAFT_533200 [Hyaloscypha variabilis F]|uniref:Uncharacterized protein n=1 Tax=Hyaloscypha variabilis (strain UAMH 11265 / GT02V1 / F) TaxID=1149755 RepID=A0A2J6RCV6_HYAVF|nr:hypothetical protein L207DRAFT_533200 [Hyaloscypha variabilis F]